MHHHTPPLRAAQVLCTASALNWLHSPPLVISKDMRALPSYIRAVLCKNCRSSSLITASGIPHPSNKSLAAH